MTDNSESIAVFSPATARVLWAIALAVTGASLALHLYGWARYGWGWTTILGPLGVFLFMLWVRRIGRSRGRLSVVLGLLALGLIGTDFILKITQL